MNYAKRQELLYKILSGVLVCEPYYIHPPSFKLKCEADELYRKTLRQCSFDDNWLSSTEVRNILLFNEIINPKIDDTIKELTKAEEDIKVHMFKNYKEPKALEFLRKSLIATRKKHNELLDKKHMFDYITAEGFSAMVKSQFLLSNTIKNKKGKKIKTVDFVLLEELMSFQLNNTVSMTEIRELSRTDPWRSYWQTDKKRIFNKPILEWTDEQRWLVSYSKMYDSIYAHSEAPETCVIEDDDLLDGWMIQMRRKKEGEEELARLDAQLTDKQRGHKEAFIVANTEDQAKKINELNSDFSKIIKAQRDVAVKTKGVVQEAELPDAKTRVI